MCLGIPARITRFDPSHADLATAAVDGVGRTVNVGILTGDGEEVAVGDWVLVHMGFAMERLDEDQAAKARSGLELLRSGNLDPLIDAGAPDDRSPRPAGRG